MRLVCNMAARGHGQIRCLKQLAFRVDHHVPKPATLSFQAIKSPRKDPAWLSFEIELM